jgi:hypothetical protein
MISNNLCEVNVLIYLKLHFLELNGGYQSSSHFNLFTFMKMLLEVTD